MLDYAIQEAVKDEKVKLIKNLILQLVLSDEQAAGVAEVSIDLVKKVRVDIS